MNEPPFNEYPYVPAMITYDAAGRQVKNTQTTSRVTPFPGNPVHTTIKTIDAVYDGDGQQVKRVETTQLNSQQPTSGTNYYLRSSVLGGQVITEYDAQGGRFKSHVYGGGALIASTSSAGLVWRYNNPVTGDGRETDPQGKLVEASYLDPEGVDVGASDPADNHGEPPPSETLPGAGAYGAFLPRSLGGSGRCSSDGMQTGCAFVAGLLAAGAAGQCPNNFCGARYIDGAWHTLTLNNEGFRYSRWVKDQPVNPTPNNSPDVIVINVKGKASGHWDYVNVPQNSRQIVGFDHIWEDLADIISDGTCRSFIADLIGTAQEITGKKAHAFSIEGLLAELKAHPKNHPMGGKDGIGLLPTATGGGAGGWDVNTGLGFANIDNYGYVGSLRLAERNLAMILLHEIIHTATKLRTSPLEAYGGYNDVELARAVFAISNDPKDNIDDPANIAPGTKFGPIARGGIIWDRALRKYCK